MFHSPAWLRVLQQTYGFAVHAHLVMGADDAPTAVLVYVPVDDVLCVRNVSLPFSDFCDPLVDEHAQWAALADSVLDQPATFTVKVLFDDVAERDERLVGRGRSKWHRADVTAGVRVDVDRLHLRHVAPFARAQLLVRRSGQPSPSQTSAASSTFSFGSRS